MRRRSDLKLYLTIIRCAVDPNAEVLSILSARLLIHGRGGMREQHTDEWV